MKRTWSLMAVLALAVGLLFAGSTPEKAEATVTWPVKVESEATNLHMTDDGDLLFANCRSSVGHSAGRIANDTVTYDPFSMGGSNMYCDSAMNEAMANDGTVFGTVLDSTATLKRLQAVKNGRVKWTFDLQWTDGCPGNARPWNTYNVESLSVGADGNLYFVAMPTVSNCPSYVVGVDAYTGEQLAFTHYNGHWAYGNTVQPRVWTYDDKIIVLESTGLKRVYNYSGVEDASKQYQYTMSTGVADALANEDGRVFVMGACGPSNMLYYSDLDGTDGSASRIDCGWGDFEDFRVGPDGKLVSYHFTHFTAHVYDMDTSPMAVQTLTTGNQWSLGYKMLYSAGITDLQVDGDGDLLATMTLSQDTSGNETDSFITYTDNATGTNADLLFIEGDGTVANRPSTFQYTPLVSDGYIYSPIKQGYTTGPGNDVYIHKTDVATAGFGTAVPQGPGFAEPTNKLEYVAMGDSFSSGEGVTPFITGTDKNAPDENRCHRSEDAYPLLLEEDEDLNLNLTAFVACSGATTSNITGTGQWGELRQLDALSSSTDVVTITIGGNNIGFKEFVTACVIEACGEDSSIYVSTINAIASLDDDLENVYQQILASIDGQGQIYVMNYPMMVPVDMEYGDLVNPLCMYLAGGTELGIAYGNWANARGAQDVIAHLNAKIEQVVYNMGNPRVHYVDVSAQFEGHDVCSINSQFIVNQLPPATFHPNGTGQEILADTMASAIG